jgi:hypothetical protein
MNTEIDLNHLDASTLLQMAHEKQREEARNARSEIKARLTELKAEYKNVQDRQRRELAALNRELQTLQAQISRSSRRTSRSGTTRPHTRRRDAPVTDALLSIVSMKPVMGITEIRDQARTSGLELKTVTQMLAYLKRTGRLTSPQRGHYAIAAAN